MIRDIRRRILRWYDAHRRDLPWRRLPADPYAQWVAEIMLQQTRVDTVIPYYQRFLGRFPTVRALAAARHQTVLKLWEGLGYYRRALNLHRGAKAVAKDDGAFPATARGLRQLPGIGEYTAAAISSIAFGEPLAAVDGNVARVVSRLFGLAGDPRTAEWKRRVREPANALISRRRPGDFNQAMMDLGSAVCVPRNPACERCPVRSACVAFQTGRVDAIPARNGKATPRRVELAAVAVVRGDRLLVRRRPRGGLWSGLWELPTIELNGQAAQQTVVKWAADFGPKRRRPDRRRGTAAPEPTAVGTISHQLTHRSLLFHVFVQRHVGRDDATAKPDTGERNDGTERWVTYRELDALPVSTAHRKILSLVGDAFPRRRTKRAGVAVSK